MLIIITTQRRRKTSEEFIKKIYILLTLFVRVQKGHPRFACERELEIERNCNILTPNARQRCVFLFLRMLNRSPGVHSTGCWLSLLHLISFFSGTQFIRASRKPLRLGVAFLTTSHLQLRPIFNSTASTSILTALYNSSTPTRSPTRSLKSNV